MNLLTSKDLCDSSIKDPHRYFKHPHDVVCDCRLDADQKERILSSWEQDEMLLLTAEEENMTEPKGGSKAAALLQAIRKAREEL